ATTTVTRVANRYASHQLKAPFLRTSVDVVVACAPMTSLVTGLGLGAAGYLLDAPGVAAGGAVVAAAGLYVERMQARALRRRRRPGGRRRGGVAVPAAEPVRRGRERLAAGPARAAAAPHVRHRRDPGPRARPARPPLGRDRRARPRRPPRTRRAERLTATCRR